MKKLFTFASRFMEFTIFSTMRHREVKPDQA